jgi:hypothetical protein
MLLSFNDDSGTHDAAKVMLLCGFLASAEIWGKLEQSWHAVLQKPEWPSIINAFHAADCVNGDGEFRGWTYPQRLAIFGDLVNVIISFPLLAIGAAVIVDDFKALTVQDREFFKKDKKATPLEFVFHLQMQQIIHRGVDLNPAEKIGVVFENSNRETQSRFLDLYIDYRDGFYLGERLTGSALFLEKKYPHLQAADILAYSTYQLVMQNYFPRDASPYFNVIPPFMRMLRGVMHDGGLYDAEALESLLKRIRAEDPSLVGNRKKRMSG